MTGESGNNSGRMTEAGRLAMAPENRSTMTSPGVPSPACTSASSLSLRERVVTTMRRRDGC